MTEDVGRMTGFGVESGVQTHPYLIEKLMPAVYRRGEVPTGMARDDLIAWASDRSVEARRWMCLVFEADECVYLTPDGCWAESSEPPAGGLVIER